ncbi:amidase [Xylariaceae sp. FL1272]|nr:amidase [Xylariaceae sp. FL1272]
MWSLSLIITLALSFSELVACDAINPRQYPTTPALIDATLDDLTSGLQDGLFTSVDLVNAYIARIGEVNTTLRMVRYLNSDALSLAADADALRANGTVLGPLHGIPILIKNNIATNDSMPNTAGSYALIGAEVPADSTVAAKLRKAGAIILGKSNLSQWANWRSENTSDGWSADGGQTEGAYYPGQNPSGSSSGSGVSSSLGLAFAALGTETAGSIISPAEVNNLVGIKPTVGLTSRYLVVPISQRQDTVGPMARTVKDAAYLLTAIAGKDDKDNYTSAIPFDTIPDYAAACNLSALSGKRLGIPRNLFDITGYEEQYGAVISAFNASLDTFQAAGAEIVDGLNLEGYYPLLTSGGFTRVLQADFLADIGDYFGKLSKNPYNITNLSELQNFTQASPLEDWPERDTLIWQGSIDLGLDNTSPEFWSNYTSNLYYGGLLGVTGALTNNSLDALIMPSAFSTTMAAVIGSPIITVPLGKYPDNQTVIPNSFGNLNQTAPNVPFGISFLGERFSEEKLVGFAYDFEQRTMVRKTIKPYIEPKTDLADVIKKRDVDLR